MIETSTLAVESGHKALKTILQFVHENCEFAVEHWTFLADRLCGSNDVSLCREFLTGIRTVENKVEATVEEIITAEKQVEKQVEKQEEKQEDNAESKVVEKKEEKIVVENKEERAVVESKDEKEAEGEQEPEEEEESVLVESEEEQRDSKIEEVKEKVHIVKIVVGEDTTYRLPVQEPFDLEELKKLVEEKLKLDCIGKEEYEIQYVDAEGDWITIASQKEWEEAMRATVGASIKVHIR